MEIHNTPEKYGVVARSLHWLLALLIIANWVLGEYMTSLPHKDPIRFGLFDFHKSIGMIVLMLVIVRLTWRLYDGAPKFAGMNPILATAARTVHYLLYVFMFVQPLSGWALSSAAGYYPTFFELFTFPGLVPKNPEVGAVYAAIHYTSAMILLTLFILHVSAALFHNFILKDNTLRRMTVN